MQLHNHVISEKGGASRGEWRSRAGSGGAAARGARGGLGRRLRQRGAGAAPAELICFSPRANPGLCPVLCPLGPRVSPFLSYSLLLGGASARRRPAPPILSPGSPRHPVLSAQVSPALGYSRVLPLCPLPSVPGTPEKDLGQLWFQSYNAWFKREERKKRDKVGYRSEESRERKIEGK